MPVFEALLVFRALPWCLGDCRRWPGTSRRGGGPWPVNLTFSYFGQNQSMSAPVRCHLGPVCRVLQGEHGVQ